MVGAERISKEDLPKPHPSYPIIARAMRELAVGNLDKPLIFDGNEGLLIALDLSQSSVWENRIPPSAENCDVASKSYEWLGREGLIELSDHGDARQASLTEKGLDMLYSLPAFEAYRQATGHADRNALIPALDGELAQRLGPGFLAWLQDGRPE